MSSTPSTPRPETLPKLPWARSRTDPPYGRSLAGTPWATRGTCDEPLESVTRAPNRRSRWWVAAALLALLVGVSVAFLARFSLTGSVPWARPFRDAQMPAAFVDDRS